MIHNIFFSSEKFWEVKIRPRKKNIFSVFLEGYLSHGRVFE